MSDVEDYRDDEELHEFIVSDEEVPETHEEDAQEEPEVDRLATLTTTLRTNETHTSRILRAHVSVLVSALGGPDHTTENGLYKLGHDALACLKDLKRWIRSVDEKNGTSDVALACAECGLVTNDLTVILCQWDKPAKGVRRTKTTDKIMLACLELLVLLTWPTEVNRKTLLKDYTAKSNMRRAQLAYKHHILAYKGGRTLKAVIRLGLTALQISKDERDPRDLSILRLILFFIRNVLFIEPLPASKGPKAITNSSDLPNGMTKEDIALPAVISAFEKNNVLLFLTSIAHSVLLDLNEESFGLLAVECLSLLVRGVKVEELYLAPQPVNPVSEATVTVPPASSAAGMDLLDLLSEETKRKNTQRNAISTRHGRFGTLLSIQNSSNHSSFTVSGQRALSSTYHSLEKLDQSKNWHKTSGFKYDSDEYVKKPTVNLGSAARSLFGFVNQLLISGSFNNLLKFVCHYLTSLANDNSLGKGGILDAADGHELASYFLTIAWFFRFKRQRNRHYQDLKTSPPAEEDSLDYGSVGAALSEVNFILLISYFRSAFESKDYDSLHVAMICFKEMLLISNSIFAAERTKEEIELQSENDINEDRELAEGIIRKLFSQKQFLDLCVNIPKQASKHSPDYLSVVVSVVHILLKSFETLTNEDVKLFIKTRRRMRKLDKTSGLNKEMDREHWQLIDRDSEDEKDEEEIRYITQERKLDFKNTEVKFFHTDTVSTHIKYLSRYEDLTHEEIKRGITYFHRLFVVRKDFAALYRLDFMDLMFKLRGFLPKTASVRRHTDDFIVYFMKKFKIALERFPTALEILFPRFETLEHRGFMSTGDLEVYTSSSSDTHSQKSSAPGLPKSSYFADDEAQPRSAPILRFIDESLSLDAKIGALIYHIIKKKNATKTVKFLTSELERVAGLVDRNISQITLRLNLGNRRLLISEPHLRLLLETVGFDLPFLQNDETILRPNVTSAELKESKESIEKWLHLHEVGVGDIEPFLDQFQREFYTSEEIQFGEHCLADLKAANPINAERAAELNLTEAQIHKLIGMAKRKEYDENMVAQYYAEKFEQTSDASADRSDDDKDEDAEKVKKKPAKRRSRRGDPVEELELDENEAPKRRRRTKKDLLNMSLDSDDESQIAKSAELVNDSDDESDDEKNDAFFAREEKLRQLIALTGGISNKEHLKMFKESWSKIVTTNSDSQVKDAIEKVAGLFVEDLDEEDSQAAVFSQNDTPLTAENMSSNNSDNESSMKRTQDQVVEFEETITRKRRIVIDDDDEE